MFPSTADINARTEKLSQEFDEMKQQCLAAAPPEMRDPDGGLDSMKLMACWLMQKVAGLQMICEYQQECINTLRKRWN